MTAVIAVQPVVVVGTDQRPPLVPICRSAKDPGAPCRFSNVCHESRQRLQHYAGLRGKRCWSYQQAINKLRAHQSHRGSQLVCFNCGTDYTRAYTLEMDVATWQTHRDWPDARVCRTCWRPASERRA